MLNIEHVRHLKQRQSWMWAALFPILLLFIGKKQVHIYLGVGACVTRWWRRTTQCLIGSTTRLIKTTKSSTARSTDRCAHSETEKGQFCGAADLAHSVYVRFTRVHSACNYEKSWQDVAHLTTSNNERLSLKQWTCVSDGRKYQTH